MSTRVTEPISSVQVRPVRPSRMPFGLTRGELISAILVLLFLAFVVFYYFNTIQPEESKLQRARADLRAQQDRVQTQGQVQAAPVDTNKQALETLETFKAEYLRPFSPGRTLLHKEINEIAKKSSLTLVSDIKLEPEEGQLCGEPPKPGQEASAKGAVFCRLNVAFSVAGTYDNLRTFISQIEKSRHFLVLNSIGLINQRSEEGEGARRNAPLGLILTIDMAAYYHSPAQ